MAVQETPIKELTHNNAVKPKNAELIKDNVDSAVKEWKNGAIIEVKQVIHSHKVTARQKPIHLANITKKYELEDLALAKVKIKKGDRYIIVDHSNKVVDNCNGYRSKNKAIAYLTHL